MPMASAPVEHSSTILWQSLKSWSSLIQQRLIQTLDHNLHCSAHFPFSSFPQYKVTMRVLSLALLLSMAQAKNLKFTITQNMGQLDGSMSDAEEVDYTITNASPSFALEKGKDHKDKKKGGNSEACGLCGPDTVGGSECDDWDITVEYRNYDVFSLFCGCAPKITGEAQCNRFGEDAVALVEEFGVTDCGVHLHCQMPDKIDDEPLSHHCQDKCALLFFGCNASCNTNCFFRIQCEALAVASPPKKKSYYDDDYYWKQ